jgi:hypothetical protein
MVVALALGCATRATRADLRYALLPGANWIINYASDGTPAGDSAAAIASAGGTELEGGDRDRGLRLFREALRRGVPDIRFYQDGIAISRSMRDSTLHRAFLAEARKRFPNESWPIPE